MSEMFQKLLNNAWTFYDNEIDRIARRAFDEVVKPFCVRRKFSFSAGGGSWHMADAYDDKVCYADLKDGDSEAQEVHNRGP